MLELDHLHVDRCMLKQDQSCPQPACNLCDVIWTFDPWLPLEEAGNDPIPQQSDRFRPSTVTR